MRKTGLALLMLSACGETPSTPESSDPIAPGGGDCPGCLMAMMPTLPAIPCSGGFVRMERDGDPGTCEPWAGDAIECERVDEAHFAGEPGCARVSVACDGDFAPDLPTGKRIYFVMPKGTGD